MMRRRCAVCTRLLPMHPWIAITIDGRERMVGGDCIKLVKSAGEWGYLTLAGERLWDWSTKTGRAAHEKREKEREAIALGGET